MCYNAHIMANIITRVVKGIWRRVDPSDRGKVFRMMKHPPAIRPDHIVFNSSEDYTGNPKALFLYMIEHGYNERYHITWLFEKPENYFEFDIVEQFVKALDFMGVPKAIEVIQHHAQLIVTKFC